MLFPVVGLFAFAFWLYRQARRLPRGEAIPSWRGKLFQIIFVFYSVFGVLAYFLHRLHMDAFTISVLAIFVGAHFLPEGQLLSNRPMIASGIVMIFWALLALSCAPVKYLASWTAIGCGLILWHSAAITVAVAIGGMPPIHWGKAEEEIPHLSPDN